MLSHCCQPRTTTTTRAATIFLIYFWTLPPTTRSMATTTAATTALTHDTQQQQRVNLLDLAAAAVACTVSSSRAIRTIETKQNARLKQDGSFVTDADYAAQGVIVQAIRAVSTAVRIVGEESAEEMTLHSIPKHRTVREQDGSSSDSQMYLQQQQEAEEAAEEDLWQRTRKEIRLLYHHHHRQQEDNEDATHDIQRLPLAEGTPDTATDAATSNVLPDDPDECLVDPRRVSVIVDPLDGTKSYTKGEYNVVSILIAIVLDNTPYFGVIGKPFGYPGLSSILDTGCATLYGGLLLNAVYVAGGRRILPFSSSVTVTAAADDAVPPKPPPRAVISGSRSKGVVYDFCKYLGTQGLVHPEPMAISGAGEKSLRLILQQHSEALWFFPKPGTSRWDVAAPDALLRVLTGKLTDKYGHALDYSVGREEAENNNGIVACADAVLHARCIELFQQGDWLNRP